MKLLFVFMIIMVAGSAIADTSYPLPHTIYLDKGGNSEFKFQIQNLRGESDIICGYGVQEDDGLNLDFPEDSFVGAGSRKNIIASVGVPRSLNYGNYTATFCVHCRPNIEAFGGGTVRRSDCGLPVNVVVGDFGERSNLLVIFLYVTVVIIVLVTIIVIIYIRRKR